MPDWNLDVVCHMASRVQKRYPTEALTRSVQGILRQFFFLITCLSDKSCPRASRVKAIPDLDMPGPGTRPNPWRCLLQGIRWTKTIPDQNLDGFCPRASRVKPILDRNRDGVCPREFGVQKRYLTKPWRGLSQGIWCKNDNQPKPWRGLSQGIPCN